MQKGINGKTIVKVEPFAGSSEKLTYSDGTVGYRYAGDKSESHPRMDEAGHLAWQDSMDGDPASADEIADMEIDLDELRKKHRDSIINEEGN